ncbi:hypothetical protein GCM10009764_41340 [Nocardia ninae]|uniref:Uncharacterized protein n=1 Tax=Nocardia ninae NBRC 108245 TaxID=1210091 RepID=A0A511MA98_9NOCA|nr:hypothetical protein NN4_21130 [Nocardia ninae NBRC 108245]
MFQGTAARWPRAKHEAARIRHFRRYVPGKPPVATERDMTECSLALCRRYVPAKPPDTAARDMTQHFAAATSHSAKVVPGHARSMASSGT